MFSSPWHVWKLTYGCHYLLCLRPTFHKIYKNKSSAGFQAVPYVVALLSALLLLYYAILKTNAILIVTINSIGCLIEVIYLIMYIVYAPRKQKVKWNRNPHLLFRDHATVNKRSSLQILTMLLILIADGGGLGLTIVVSTFIVKGSNRVHAVGLICAIFNIAVFASPLSIMVLSCSYKSLYTFSNKLIIFYKDVKLWHELHYRGGSWKQRV